MISLNQNSDNRSIDEGLQRRKEQSFNYFNLNEVDKVYMKRASAPVNGIKEKDDKMIIPYFLFTEFAVIYADIGIINIHPIELKSILIISATNVFVFTTSIREHFP